MTFQEQKATKPQHRMTFEYLLNEKVVCSITLILFTP